MKRALITSALIAVFLLAFILTPQAWVDPGIGEPVFDFQRGTNKPRPEKSGLRIAIEGRLHWLGVI